MTRIPVSIVTGFLGVGKTTLLNRFLATGAFDRAALVINEFGDIGIDHMLVDTADEGIIELSGGCLCCSLRSDLADTLLRLLDRNPAPDRIVIETTGLADPGPVAEAIVGHSELSQRTRLAGILALIDGVDGSRILAGHQEARQQIAFADHIVKTKTDVGPTSTTLGADLERLNAYAPVIDLTSFEEPSPAWLEGATATTSEQNAQTVNHRLDLNNGHESEISAVSLTSEHAMTLATLELFLHTLIQRHGDRILRIKGLIKTVTDPERPLVIQGIGTTFQPPRSLPSWPGEDKSNRLVIIGRNLNSAAITRLFDSLIDIPQADTPDRQALTDNPLATPGFS